MPRGKGIRAERELAQILWDRGFACIRGPASGARLRKRFCPDLVALKNGTIFIFEIKYRKGDRTIYLEKDKISKLKDFAKRAGGYALIAIRTKADKKWRFIRVEDLEETPESYKVTLDKLNKALTLRDLCALADKTVPLDAFK